MSPPTPWNLYTVHSWPKQQENGSSCVYSHSVVRRFYRRPSTNVPELSSSSWAAAPPPALLHPPRSSRGALQRKYSASSWQRPSGPQRQHQWQQKHQRGPNPWSMLKGPWMRSQYTRGAREGGMKGKVVQKGKRGSFQGKWQLSQQRLLLYSKWKLEVRRAMIRSTAPSFTALSTSFLNTCLDCRNSSAVSIHNAWWYLLRDIILWGVVHSHSFERKTMMYSISFSNIVGKDCTIRVHKFYPCLE